MLRRCSATPGCRDTCTRRQREQFNTFVNKALGWFTVAGGAVLLAAEQTWDVVTD